MNYVDLFHGIGGFALGAYWSGMKFDNHFCSDIEPYCQKLYAMRFPDSIQLGDITKIDTEELKKYGTDWIITGGFPCQDISIAGKGAGITGSRSGLWFEYWRLIRDLRPRIAIMENVGMLVHRGLREVLGSLAEIGYDAEWQDIRASDMGAPHRRERIWIVAYDNGFASTFGGNDKTDEKESGFRCHFNSGGGKDDWRFPNSQTHENVADTLRERTAAGIPEPEEREERNAGVINNNNLQERHGDLSEWWSVEPAVGRLAHGVPSRVDRLKGLGNAIVPQIAELLFNQIKELL